MKRGRFGPGSRRVLRTRILGTVAGVGVGLGLLLMGGLVTVQAALFIAVRATTRRAAIEREAGGVP